ncbi:ABC transporter permease subunit [Streptomyces arboris]|uniref:ABC transporter permease subunit n=1 Tax=Streptomyces arboris TaxID=2600619 RepID=UPI001CEF8ED8
MTTPPSVRKRVAAAPAPVPAGRRPERGARWRRVGLRLVALAALLALWLLAIAAMPPVAVATASAVASAPTALVEAAGAIGARRGQVVTSVVLPSALPEILVGVRLAFGITGTGPDELRGLPEYAALRAEIGTAVRDAAR